MPREVQGMRGWQRCGRGHKEGADSRVWHGESKDSLHHSQHSAHRAKGEEDLEEHINSACEGW